MNCSELGQHKQQLFREKGPKPQPGTTWETAATLTIPRCLARLPQSFCHPKHRAGKILPKSNKSASCGCVTSDPLYRKRKDNVGCEKHIHGKIQKGGSQRRKNTGRRESKEEKQRWEQIAALADSKSRKEHRW